MFELLARRVFNPNSMPNYLIHIAASLIILTKLADVWTTLRFLDSGSIAMERNGFARKLMYRFGYKRIVLAVLAATISIVGISDFVVIRADNMLYDISFVIIALLISVVQAAVAMYNYFGKANVIVRFVGKFRFYS